VWSLGALSDLAAASYSEDTYGVSQLSSPHLADVLLSLLGTVAVLQAYCKQLVSRGRGRGQYGRTKSFLPPLPGPVSMQGVGINPSAA
jgi:hypothetical protein